MSRTFYFWNTTFWPSAIVSHLKFDFETNYLLELKGKDKIEITDSKKN